MTAGNAFLIRDWTRTLRVKSGFQRKLYKSLYGVISHVLEPLAARWKEGTREEASPVGKCAYTSAVTITSGGFGGLSIAGWDVSVWV